MAQDLIDKIREQAQARGLDPEIAVRIAQVESSLDPSAKAKTSSAQGLFQVVDKTWKDFGGKPGQKNNPDENIRVGLNILESNTKSLRSALGRDPSPTELYAAHFLGAQGAKTLLTANPDTPVSELLSQRAIKANPTMLKDKSARELIAVLDAKMGMPQSRPTAQPAPTTPQAPMPAPAAGAPKRATPAPVAAQNMGAGYQAALALSFLGDEEEDGQPLSREEWQARTDEKSAADMLAEYKPKNALSQINWDESSLVARAPVQAPQRMAGGGEMVSDDVKFHQGTDALVGREPYRAPEQQQAYVEAMNPGVFIADVNMPRGIFGAVDSRAPDVVQIARDQSPAQREQTLLHEMEHSLDFRGGDILGRPDVKRTDQSYRAYHLLNKNWAPIRQFVDNVSSNREKLEQFFGMPMTSGYLKMTPERVKEEKAKYGRDAMLPFFDEQLASLSALEQTTGKSLTRDPEMRKLFPNTQMMAVYDALTGLRQTRLDARDLPPHTPLPSYTYETNPVTRFIREKTTGKNEYGIPIKRADGGEVDLEGLQNEARKGDAYRLMEEYLATRDAMPTIKAKKLPEPTNAVFTALRLPAGRGTITVHKDPEVMAAIGPSLMAHELAHAADRQMGQQASEQSSVFGGGNQFTEAYDKMVGRGPFVSGKKRTELARKVNPDWASFNKGYRASPEEIAGHGVGAFAPGKNMQDSAPLHVDATAATEFQILLDLAQRNANKKSTGLVKIPNFLKQVVGFSNGGEVEPTPEEIAAASRPAFRTSRSGIGRNITLSSGQVNDAVLQGLMETPYNVAGVFADVPAMVMRPFGYTNPTPILGSEWLKQQATRLGIRPEPPTQPTARALYEMGQLGGALVNPTAPVRGAIAAGKAGSRAAKEMLQDFQTYNRELVAPGASYAVKPKGGEFTMERPAYHPDKFRRGPSRTDRVDAVENYLESQIGATMDSPLDYWVVEKLGRYMRRDMASPEDQFVKAAEQGRTLHFLPDKEAAKAYSGDSSFLKYVRQGEGFNPKGEATTPYGKAVENQVDMSVEPVRVGDFVDSPLRLREPLRAQMETNPEARVYDLMGEEVTDRLQLPQMVETMEAIRNSNGVFRVYGREVPIPKEYQLSDETLKGLSPAQASERVAAYTKWTDKARQQAASEAIIKNSRLDRVQMKEGNTWVRLPDTQDSPEIREIVQDVGCAGGWCTKNANYALSEGSGENRLHLLMGKDARPKAQLTLATVEANPDRFLSSLHDAEYDAFIARHPGATYYGDIAKTPEYQKWAKLNPTTVSITELKGSNNRLDLKDSPVLPDIQNYIKKLARETPLESVNNLDGINMMDSSALDVYSAVSNRLDTGAARVDNQSFMEAIYKVQNSIIKKNEGSRFIVKEDGPRLLQEALDDVLGVEKKAHGGMVERHRDDNRKYL